MSNYLIGLNGEQLDEYDGTGTNLIHSNVFRDGALLATFSGSTWNYAFNDWLGTKRVQISADGNLANLSTFASLPFGDGLYKTGSDATEQHFTGKERDAESGLDYFGARYYASSMGRFMSPDPSKLSILRTNPQTWNRYSYVYNNPLRLKDDNGKWPTEIHNQLIDQSFPNLTSAQRQILKNISAEQDGLMNGGQSEALSYQHAMRAPNQTVAEAEGQYNNFVSSEEDGARDLEKEWLDPGEDATLSPAALADFAHALHAILDSTSPAHAGFQVWDYSPIHLAQHHNNESSITLQQRGNAIGAAQNAFMATFGSFGFKPDNATVTTTQGDGQPCGGSTGIPCGK